MAHNKRPITRQHRASVKVARKNYPDHVYWGTDEDSYEDFPPKVPLGSPTLLSGSNFISDSKREERREETPERTKLFSDLLNALYSPCHKIYGSFASCEAVKYSQGLLMKSFHVEGAGELQVPLSAEDVSKLRKLLGVCKKRCLKIDASKITFPGAPEFISNTIQPLAKHAVRKLSRHGAAVPLSVQLHKLLFCDTDQDTWSLCHDFTCSTGEEKGFFASLVLQIPTEDGYKGGGLMVRHRNSEKTFDCHLVSSVGFCYSVFFADCRQQWRRIKSGTRLCMIFNLFRQDSCVEASQRDFIACKVREAEFALQPWLSDVMEGKCDIYSPKLAIPLSYKYGKDELFFDEVKGDDRIVLEVLKRCRDENGKQLLDLHLCLVPASYCRNRVSRSSSPRDFPHFRHATNNDLSGDCNRHHGDGDEDNHYHQGWEYDCSSYYKNIPAACANSDRVSRMGELEEAIIFWAGETGKVTMPFELLGLDNSEVVVSNTRNHSEDEDDGIKYWYGGRGYCSRLWYRAILVLWPKELSISVFCETKLSLALDLLEMTKRSTDPEFCEHLLRILCWCNNNASRLWATDCKFDLVPRLLKLCRRARDFTVCGYDCNSNLMIPTLFQLCAGAGHLENVLQNVFKLLGRGAIWIGTSMKVAKEVAALIQAYGSTECSPFILELVEQLALFQGRALVRLAKELILIDLKVVGTVVAKTTIEVFKARITELERRTKPRFTWCQPQAEFPSNSMIENFLKGPQERFTLDNFKTFNHACSSLHAIMRSKNVREDHQFHGELIEENETHMVELHKTKRHFEILMERWKGAPDQLLALRTELRRITSAFRQVGAFGVEPIPKEDLQHYVLKFSDNCLEAFI